MVSRSGSRRARAWAWWHVCWSWGVCAVDCCGGRLVEAAVVVGMAGGEWERASSLEEELWERFCLLRGLFFAMGWTRENMVEKGGSGEVLE